MRMTITEVVKNIYEETIKNTQEKPLNHKEKRSTKK